MKQQLLTRPCFFLQVEGENNAEDRPHFGYDYYNASTFQDTSSAALASEEAEGEIIRCCLSKSGLTLSYNSYDLLSFPVSSINLFSLKITCFSRFEPCSYTLHLTQLSSCKVPHNYILKSELICRRRQLHERDPVNCIRLSTFLKDNINQGLAVNGQSFQAAMAGLDPNLMSSLQKALA